MPVTPTYPGVYIEEVPSGVRTITGVATAITAFIGRAPRGAVDTPVRIQNFGDYTRAFGGLSLDSTMSFAVQQFFNNGGTDAIIVRVYRAPAPGATGTPRRTGIGSCVLAADTRARGTLTLAVQPVVDDTMTLDRTEYTFRANGAPLDVPEAPGAGQPIPMAVNVELGATLPETQATIIRAINNRGSTGFRRSETAQDSVTAADKFVDNKLILTAKEDGTTGNAIATAESFADPANTFDAATLGTTSPGRGLVGAAAAQGTLSIASQPPATQTFTINGREYTFDAPGALDDTIADHIEIGTTIGDTRTNVINAINAGGTPGTGYSTPTTQNADVEAAAGPTAAAIVLTARTPGAAGNTITTEDTMAAAGNGFDAGTLGTTRAGTDGTPIPSLTVEAKNPGAWSSNVRIWVTHDLANPADLKAFSLEIEEIDPSLPAGAPPLQTERFYNLSVDPMSPLHVDGVLASRSQLIRVRTTSSERPGLGNAGVALTGGDDGQQLDDNSISEPGLEADKEGLWSLQNADLFNILCIPPLAFDKDIGPTTRDAALKYCKDRRAFFVVDPPAGWVDVTAAETGVDSLNLRDENAALYFPRVNVANPLRDNQLSEFAPCGVIAGVYARTDALRGVWKAPAGTEATMAGVRTLSVPMTDAENGRLNPSGVNCLRSFPVTGNVVWGARTLEGADHLASEWKYVSVRRTALYLEESLYRGLKWVVFEPNDEPLWAQIRLNVGSFMHTLFRRGAFQGSSPRDAYLVKCDAETTTQADIDRGIVNILVGFAPLKPAEFVFVKIQQLAGQLET
ncbi:MAG TPA: phage tail sheath C-terminal domain-containing protein [Candidatus Limnocylindrales bacterium]|nr:phage tail sheath C-terminal domain-containing protein [Candidatus Limnocylindrales bacterium]